MAQDTKSTDLSEEYAYTLGVQAYIFSFSWVLLTGIRHAWVVANESKKDVTFYMTLNRWWHGRNILTSDYRDSGSPNNDTLYSMSLMDLSKEPVTLSHPDMGDRYFTFEFGSATSDNFGYVGKLHTGSKAGHFALFGPDWKGTLPDDIRLLEQSNGTKHIGANAMLSIFTEEEVHDVVVVLGELSLDGGEITYPIKILDGEMPEKGGPYALFIDVIGHPMTPVSVAGSTPTP